MKYYNYPEGRTYVSDNLDSVNTDVFMGPKGKYVASNELPAITPEDAGKVVKVKEDGTGIEYGDLPSGAFIVTFSGSGSPTVTLTADKTKAEIDEAYAAGKPIFGFCTNFIVGYGVYFCSPTTLYGATPLGYVFTSAKMNSNLGGCNLDVRLIKFEYGAITYDVAPFFGNGPDGYELVPHNTNTVDGNYVWKSNVASSYASNGSWQLESSGGGLLVVNVSYNSGTNTFTADKTFAEVVAAFPNVILRYSWYDAYTYKENVAIFVPTASWDNASFMSTNSGISFTTLSAYWDPTEGNNNSFTMWWDDRISIEKSDVLPPPHPTSSAADCTYVLKYKVENWAGSFVWEQET